MRRYIFAGFAGALVLLLSPLSAKAEVVTASCFDYYSFGSVEAKLSADLLSVSPGSVMTVTGTLINHNAYPIIDGGLRVKVFRKESEGEKNPNGPAVVDQFDVVNQLDLGANASKDFSFEWQVPQYALSGDYEFATFFTSSKKFNLLGLSFTDDVVGNTLDFSVNRAGADEGIVEFDKTSGMYNGQKYFFVSYAPRIGYDTPFDFSIKVRNTTGTSKDVPITWKLYSWDSLLDANLISSKQELVSINDGDETVITYSVPDKTKPVYYLVGEIRYADTKSMIGVRFVREGVDSIRINFPSVTSFPLIAGTSTSIFSCFHGSGAAAVVPGGRIVLTLADKAGNTIRKSAYTTDVTGEMMGIIDTFVPSQTYDQFSLTADLYKDGVLVDTTSKNYDCIAINPEQCSDETRYGIKQNDTMLNSLILGAAALLALLIGIMLLKKKKTLPPTIAMLLLVLAAGAYAPQSVHAADTSWNSSDIPTLFIPFNSGGSYSGVRALDNINVTVQYHANVVNANSGTVIKNGDTIAAGTPIKLTFTPHVSGDLFWFATGYAGDSPYGDWVSGAANNSAQCEEKDFVTKSATQCTASQLNAVFKSCSSKIGGTCKDQLPYNGNLLDKIFGFLTGAKNVFAQYVYTGYNVYAPLSVNPPTKSISGTTGLNCGKPDSSGNVSCTPQTAGTYTVKFNFSNTYGKFYYQSKDLSNNVCTPVNMALREGSSRSDTSCGQLAFVIADSDYSLSIPSRSISVSFKVSGAVNKAPSVSITGPSTGVTGTSYGFDIGGSDPEGDSITYYVDWNNDNKADQTLTSAGKAYHTWSSAGTYTVQAMAKDSKGASSVWKETSIKITVAPSDHVPEGWFEAASCSAISGWAVDRDTSNSSIDVHVYKDGPAGSGTFVTYATANNSRPDVNSTLGITGNHGYSIVTPESLKDNVPHSIYVYGINSKPGGVNSLISGSPKSIQCAPPVKPACSDGKDNDGDKKIDYPNDPGCADTTDNDETDFIAPQPTAKISASTETISSAASVVLSWGSTNATSCTASGGWSGAKGTSGSQNVSVSKTTTYTITCSGSGGSATDSVTVTLQTKSFCELNPTDPSCSPSCTNPPCGGSGGNSQCSDGIDNDADGKIDYPSDPQCSSASDTSESGGGCQGPSCPVLGFTITSVQSSVTPVQFVGGLSGASDPRRLEINPVNGFSSPVTLRITSIKSKASGAALPSGVEVLYSLDDKAFDSNPSTTLTYTASRYVGEAGVTGANFKASFSKPITEAYNVTIQGTSGSLTATYVITVDPKAVNPDFREI